MNNILRALEANTTVRNPALNIDTLNALISYHISLCQPARLSNGALIINVPAVMGILYASSDHRELLLNPAQRGSFNSMLNGASSRLLSLASSSNEQIQLWNAMYNTPTT